MGMRLGSQGKSSETFMEAINGALKHESKFGENKENCQKFKENLETFGVPTETPKLAKFYGLSNFTLYLLNKSWNANFSNSIIFNIKSINRWRSGHPY